MIILLSGEKKYSVEGASLEKVDELGRLLYETLERGDSAQFKELLQNLHSFVKENGVNVDPLRKADLVIPSPICDANEFRALFNLQKTP